MSARWFDLVRPHRWRLALIALLTLGGSALTLALPWLAATTLGKVIVGQAVDLGAGVLVLIVLLAAIAAASAASAIAAKSAALEIRSSLGEYFHWRLQRLPAAFHDGHRKGDLLSLTVFDLDRIVDFLSSTLVGLPAQLLIIAGSAVLMYAIQPALGLMVFALVPVFYLAMKLVKRRMRSLAWAIRDAESDLIAHNEEGLQMLPVVKTFAQEARRDRRHAALLDRFRGLSLSELRLTGTIAPVAGLVASVLAVLIIAYAGTGVRDGTMTPTQLFGLMFYAALLAQPVSSLAHIYGEVQSARGALERVDRFLEEPEEAGYAIAPDGFRAQGDIRFDNVEFAYAGNRGAIFRNLDLTIPGGRTTVIIGPNGAGKTTLVHLLLRLYDVDRGTISIGGRDIATVNLTELRQNFGFVPQRTLIANGTIREAILFGRDGDATAVETAARLAQASDFIATLPDGYDTMIGEQGVLLSGGQRQKLALARALLADPPILILDEATSMFDGESDDAFLDQFETAFAGRTVLMISHRAEAAARADAVLTVDTGRVSIDLGGGSGQSRGSIAAGRSPAL